jgi:hypothetical protein
VRLAFAPSRGKGVSSGPRYTPVIASGNPERRGSQYARSGLLLDSYVLFFGVNNAPHFGHLILSKSIRTISLGAIE